MGKIKKVHFVIASGTLIALAFSFHLQGLLGWQEYVLRSWYSSLAFGWSVIRESILGSWYADTRSKCAYRHFERFQVSTL